MREVVVLKLRMLFLVAVILIVVAATASQAASPYDDDFASATLAPKWSWVREDPARWNLTENPGALRIYTQRGDLLDNDNKNLLLQDAPAGDFDVVTKVAINPTQDYQQAALLLYQDDDHYIRIDRAYSWGVFQDGVVEFTYNDSSDFRREGYWADTIYLKISKRGSSYGGYYSWDDVNWHQVGAISDPNLNNLKIGLAAFNGRSDVDTTPADFEYVRVVQIPDAAVYPIVYVPGIGASYLYKDDSTKVWLSPDQAVASKLGCDGLIKSDMCLLRFTSQGKPTDEGAIWLGDIIRDETVLWVLGNNTGGNYMNFLRNKGYNENYPNNMARRDWLAEYRSGSGYLSTFAYDFRNSIESNAQKLALHIKTVLKNTGADKVILTAHSTGGLIARTYIVDSGGINVAGLVTIGTPWLGSPMLTKAMITGWDFEAMLDTNLVKDMVTNWPGAHGLGPGPQYLEAYPEGFLSEEIRDLEGHVTKLVPANDLAAQKDEQRSFNPAMYDAVQTWRSRIFNGRNYGVPTHVIAGRHVTDQGEPDTMVSYDYRCLPQTDWFGITTLNCTETKYMAEGDNTVPLKSAFPGCTPEQVGVDAACDRFIGSYTPHIVDGPDARHGDLPKLGKVEEMVWNAVQEFECRTPQCARIKVEPFSWRVGDDYVFSAVLTDGTGAPLAGKEIQGNVTIVGGMPLASPSLKATTDAQGRAIFNLYGGWNAGSGVSVNVTAYFAGDGEHRSYSYSRPFDLLPSSGGTLSFTVVNDSTGATVSGPSILVNRDGHFVLNLGSSSGSFSYQHVAEHSYQVHVTAAGYYAKDLVVQTVEGQTTNVEVRMSPIPPASVSGVVRNLAGQPVAGASVGISYGPGLAAIQQMVTGANGAYSFTGLIPSSTYQLVVSRSGFQNLQSSTFSLSAAQSYSRDLDLTLSSPDLSFSATTPSAAPRTVAAGTTVTLSGSSVLNLGSAASSCSAGYYLSADATLNSADTFLDAVSLPALSSGGSYQVPERGVTIPAGTVPGNYYIGLVLDSGAILGELNTSNNYQALPITVTAPSATLSVALSGSGTVASQPQGIACAPACSAAFDSNGQVVLTAAPAAGYGIEWSSCDSVSGNQCTVQMGANRQVGATFQKLAVKAGDCDGNDTVSVGEVQSAINMYLGLKQVDWCVDQDDSKGVSTTELQKTINTYLGL